MKKEKKTKSSSEEINLSNKEKELLVSYNDELQDEYEFEEEQVILTDLYDTKKEAIKESEELEEYEVVEEEKKPKNKDTKRKIKSKKDPVRRKMNIIFTIIIILLLMISADIILVTKYDKGPFFAIPIHKYDDGGTKEYYGLGYKVIKYNQVQGRRDRELGTWRLKYNIEPVYADAIDLAIEFNNNETKAYKKYYKKFMRVSGTLVNVSKKQNSLTISYYDEDGSKYDLDIICDMETEKEMLNSLSTNMEVASIGTMTNYKYKTEKTPATIYLSNCFAEQ